ncbi:MAG TPA: DNA translocase FtsK [Candidatus Woesebacteria bacterium]|nr:DNA translocase FtsK [Candidatus Woesebacteria bacterium]
MDNNKKIKLLEERVGKLEKLVEKTNKYIIYMELRSSGIDPAYDDALKLIKDRDFVTFHWLQSKLDIGYARTGHIIDKLEKEGKIEPEVKNREKRKVKN